MTVRKCKAASSVFKFFWTQGENVRHAFVDWRSDIGEKPQGARLGRG